MNESDEDRIIREALREADPPFIDRVKARLKRMNKSHLVIALILMATGWLFRWETIPISNGDSTGGLYILNRWTGALYVVYQDQRLVVKEFKETAVIGTGETKKPATFSFEEATAPSGPDDSIKYGPEDKPAK